MGGIYKENYKRANKKNSVSAVDGHDLIRVEDIGSISGLITTSDIPGSGTAEGDLLVSSSDGSWTLLPKSTVDGYVLKTSGATLAWAPDASGAGGGEPDLSASGFITSSDGIGGATDRAILFYDGPSATTIIADADFNYDDGASLLNVRNISILKSIHHTPDIISTPGDTLRDNTNLFVTSSSSGNLPAGISDGRIITITDASGVAGSTPIRVGGNGALIDGAVEIVLANNYESVTLMYNGSTGGWHTISDANASTPGVTPEDIAASGFVVGPSSANDAYFVLFDTNSGKLIQEAPFMLYDLGADTIRVDDKFLATDESTFNQKITFNRRTIYTPEILSSDGFVTDGNINLVRSTASSGNLFSSPENGCVMTVKDADGVAAGAPITIDGNGSTIDGAAQITLTNNYESVSLVYSTTTGEWHVI